MGKQLLLKHASPIYHIKNLEHLETREFAKEDPVAFLNTIPDGGIIDEVQYVSELFSYENTKFWAERAC